MKKTLIASMVSLMSLSANADLVRMDDNEMKNITGKSGVLITNIFKEGTGYDDGDSSTNDAAIQIESIIYKDEGGLKISNIALGSENGLSIVSEIDALSDGTLQIVTRESTGLNLQIGAINLVRSDDSVVSAPLLSNLDLNFDLGESTLQIGQGDNIRTPDSNNMISLDTSIKINSSSFDLLNESIGIRDFTFDKDGDYSNIVAKIWGDPNGLSIQTESIEGSIRVGSLLIGGESIGSLEINNIRLNGLTTVIKGKL